MVNKTQRVVIIRSNPVHTDSRLIKEIHALSTRYQVIVLGWDREGVHSRYDTIDSCALVKRLRLRAPYGKFSIIMYYPLFWIWVVVNLAVYRPDVVHACDLDALIPARIFGFLVGSRIVFDNFDKFAMAFIPTSNQVIYRFVDWLEDLLVHKSNLLIVVSPDRLRTFRWIPENRVQVMNCPEDVRTHKLQAFLSEPECARDFVLVYAGVISNDRGLILIEKAIRNIEGVRLLVAGRQVHQRVLDQLIRNPKIQYLGLLTPDKAIELEAQADAIPLLYDPAVPINRVASPNKLFEAMMLGVPVISNVCKSIVEDVGCGVIVDYDIDSFRNAILNFIRSPESKRAMGMMGRRAFETAYNWDLMEHRLLEAYRLVLSSSL